MPLYYFQTDSSCSNMCQYASISSFSLPSVSSTKATPAASPLGAEADGTTCSDYTFKVSWNGWKDNQKVKNPVKSWDKTSDKKTCLNLCAQYAEENNYVKAFLCSYQFDKSPKTCTISADDDGDGNKSDTSHWIKNKGYPSGGTGNLLTPTVENSILDVANNAEKTINDAVVTVLTNELDPINGGFEQVRYVFIFSYRTCTKTALP